jgi:hypothetical protein
MSYKSVQNYSRSSTLYSRPLGVTLLAFGVLMIAGFNLVRGIQAAIQWQFLSPLLSGLPLYQGLSGFLWAVVGVPLAGGLWRGIPWAARLMRWATLLYSVYFWLDRLLLRRGAEPANLPFTLGLTALVITFVFWTLSKASVRAYFGDSKA